MSDRPSGSVTLSPAALGFGAAMLGLGVVIGWLARGAPAPPPPVVTPEPIAAVDEAPSVEVKKKKKGPPPTLPPIPDVGPPPADSPYLPAAAQITNAEQRKDYEQAIALLAANEVKSAVRLLARLEDESMGQPWRAAGLALVVEGRAAAGEVGPPRYLAKGYRLEFPESPFLSSVLISEAATYLRQADRTTKPRGGKTVEQQQAEAKEQARKLLEEALVHDPKGPFASKAQGMIAGL